MPACRSRTMGGNKLDNAVWAYVSSMINDFEKVKSAVKDLKKKREEDKSANKKSRDNLLIEKNNLKIKRGKLFELYSEMGKVMSVSAKEDMDLKLKEIDEKEKNDRQTNFRIRRGHEGD
jgi:molybdenum-dependent DNA-binding transcriptional regulator ModE